MRTVDLQRHGGPEVLNLAEAPVPQPGAGEVLIRVAAAGINRADILQREGKYPPPPGASPILGLEVAGHISAIGPAADSRWKQGDAVCALLAGGGYAEYCVAPTGQCLPVPDDLPLTSAAALPEAVFTVWANLFSPRRVFPGNLLLVQGGASGIGTMAIQMARQFGARVAATAGSKEKCRFCMEELHCERAFNYRAEDWVAAAQTWSQPHGIDVILDMIAGDYFPHHLKLLATDGRLVHISTTHGSEVPLDLRTVMSKRLIITGSTLRSRPIQEKERLRDEIEQGVWPLFSKRELHPVIDRIFLLKEVVEAHRYMDSSRHIGKIVLDLSQNR